MLLVLKISKKKNFSTIFNAFSSISRKNSIIRSDNIKSATVNKMSKIFCITTISTTMSFTNDNDSTWNNDKFKKDTH